MFRMRFRMFFMLNSFAIVECNEELVEGGATMAMARPNSNLGKQGSLIFLGVGLIHE